MKIMVIGGVTHLGDDENYQSELADLDAAMESVGAEIVASGHDLIACSPFSGSADLGAIRGAATELRKRGQRGPRIEIHCPSESAVLTEIAKLTGELPDECCRVFRHPLSTGGDGKPNWEFSWLLSQLAALDNSQAVIALGGKTSGAASLLLTLGQTKSKHILPLAFLGGAAAHALESLRWPLDDLFKDTLAQLYQPDSARNAISLVDRLVSRSSRSQSIELTTRFFVSYSRSRPSDADFVEMILRRRQLGVYRDDRYFKAGGDLPHEIRAHIERSDVFIAIWCKEYACSPWCHDELSLALDLHKAGKLELWILNVDDTRMVPPAARNLVSYRANGRDELERHMLTLLECRCGNEA